MRMRRILAALTAVCLIALCAPVRGAVADTEYYITVDITNQIVTIYDSEKTDDINIVRQMICTTGKKATPTPLGTFRLPARSSGERTEWYYFPKFKCYAKWATRITGGILFHSTLFTSAKKGPTSSSTRALGSRGSHGCVRLRVADAKFIADNCGTGTKVKIYSSGKTNSKLRSKLKKKTFIRDKQTYDSFLGRKPTESPLPLSKGSTGTLVTQLQTRLKELGFYTGQVNGSMGKTTVNAVKAFQAASGLAKTSSVDQALWDFMFSDGAPVGTAVTLAEGSTGAAVAALQNNLTTLLMFSGSADGNYTAQTTEAVTNYQNTFGFAVTGSADTDLQNDIISRAAQVREAFGGTTYALGTVTTDARMAKVKAKYGTKLLKTASKKSKSIKKLKKNTALRVLNEGKTWIKVKYGTRLGYVKKSALKLYNEPVTENGYVQVQLAPEPAPDPTPTPTPEVYIPTEAAAEEEPLTMEAEAAEGELVYGTEAVETPAPEPEANEAEAGEEAGEALAFDEALEIEPEPTPEPEYDLIPEEEIPVEAIDGEGAPEGEDLGEDAPAIEAEIIETTEE